MKKYLLLSLSILSIFFFNNRVNALSFTASNGKEYTVDSTEKLLDYCYYTYYKDKNMNTLVLTKNINTQYPYKCMVYNNTSNLYIYQKSSSFILYVGSSNRSYKYYQFSYNYNYLDSGNIMQSETEILYTNSDVYSNSSFSEIYMNSNFKINDIEERYSEIVKYKITYYLNNEIYKEFEVEKGSSYTLIEYTPPKNYNFSGWTVENDLDLTNISSDINIYGTTTYVRPDMNYSENINSKIHELSVSIIGKNMPVEFDFVYTIMDYLILLVIVFCVLAPFILAIKLLGCIL